MIFFLSCFLSVMSLIGMENNNSLVPMVVTNPIQSLYQIASQVVCDHLINKKITPQQVNALPKEILEKITTFVKPLTLTITKRYILPSLTPDHRYMLVNEEDKYFRWNVHTKQEMPIDLLSTKKEKPIWTTLSPSGNLVACFSNKQMWIKDIKNNTIQAENRFGISCPKQITFIREKSLLVEDQNDMIHCFSIKNEIVEGPLSTFKYLGVLPTTAQFLVLHESCIMKSDDGSSYVGITNIEEPSRVKPAIYEPDLLMAYELKKFNGFINIISLQEDQQAPLGQLITASTITALSFTHKGKWLAIANIDKIKNIPQIALYDWKNKNILCRYELSNPINAISYTQQLSEDSCIFETRNALSSTCLHSFDPIKAVACAMLKGTQKTISNNNNNNETNIDIDKN